MNPERYYLCACGRENASESHACPRCGRVKPGRITARHIAAFLARRGKMWEDRASTAAEERSSDGR